MNRLIAIGLSLLMLVGFSADAVAVSDGGPMGRGVWCDRVWLRDEAL
jgi:hypothetical protein